MTNPPPDPQQSRWLQATVNDMRGALETAGYRNVAGREPELVRDLAERHAADRDLLEHLRQTNLELEQSLADVVAELAASRQHARDLEQQIIRSDDVAWPGDPEDALP